MDMSFARRRKASLRSGTPTLSTLLSELGARQASSRTARIQARIQAASEPVEGAPLIEIFAGEQAAVARACRFDDSPVLSVTPRKPT